MSVINQALNEVQRQQRERHALEAGASPDNSDADEKTPSPPRRRTWIWVLSNLVVLLAVTIGGYLFFRDAPPETLSDSVAPLLPQGQSTRASAPTINPASTSTSVATTSHVMSISPFSPAPSSLAQTRPAQGEYELAGMTVVGKDTLLSVTRRSDQRRFWVAVGKTVGDVSAISYNAESDTALIRVRGQLVTIAAGGSGVH